MLSLLAAASRLRPPALALASSLTLLCSAPPLPAQEAPAPPAEALAPPPEAPAPLSAPALEMQFPPVILPGNGPGDGDAGAEPGEIPGGLMPDEFPPPPSLEVTLEDPPVPFDLLAPEGGVPTPTENVVVNLINRLVDRGVLTQADAAELVSQAQRDAMIASQNAAAAALLAADAAMATEEDIVVTHIPEPVKDRLREEIRQDIMAQAEATAGAGRGALPEWVENSRVFGDFRMRYDATIFPEGNDITGSFPNFNRINTGDPFDVAGFDFSPQLNVNEERHRYRMRARLGAHTRLGDGFSLGFRAATGNDNSPVSTNQTLSSNFNKYSLWLDQAFLRWEEVAYNGEVSVTLGRFENPFFRATDVMWDNDLAFDGMAFHLGLDVADGVRPFVTAGVFPIFNTGFNFPDNNPEKFESTDRYLYGAQGGVDVAFHRHVEGKFGLGYHDFSEVQGELSEPFLPFSPKDAGSTDSRRPPYAQKGNTYMALRDIIPDPLNGFGTMMQYQYFGLASKFQILSYNGRLDLNFWEPFQIRLLGEYATNLAFDAEEINQIALNNRGPLSEEGLPGDFEGGNVAWNFGVQFGKAAFERAGDWNATLGYRFVESDAVMDAFNDSDFGLGGTNLEGFTVGAGIALTPKVNLNLRWMGASEIAGPPLSSDIIQFDINAKF